MATKIEDVHKAIEVIQAYRDEFDASFSKRMESLKGKDIEALCDDRRRMDYIRHNLSEIRTGITDLNFPE